MNKTLTSLELLVIAAIAGILAVVFQGVIGAGLGVLAVLCATFAVTTLIATK
jgi:hypothetical protein